ncbi:hypothetical protein AgCh_018330 [Apium graveolens]
MVTRTSVPVDDLNVDVLVHYCSQHVHSFPPAPTQMTISKFGHGQSNPTYLLEVSSGGSPVSVLNALGTCTLVPVPKVFCLCTDSAVIGTPFYIMEYLEGRIFIDPTLPFSLRLGRAIYSATAKALASLHSADVDAIGLGKYGRRDNYCKRQVDRWAKQYLASTGEGMSPRNPKMLELVYWLQPHIPSEDSISTKAGLVHGDFRIDNRVFHPIEDKVIGILDWELSTLGNQMCDVAYSTLHYLVDFDLEKVHEHEGIEATGIPEGIPLLSEYLADYCSASRKPWPVAEWKFYVAFSLFRGVSIHAGLHSRWLMGNASGGKRAQNSGIKADAIIEAAWSFIEQKSVLPQHPPFDRSAREQLEQLNNRSNNQETVIGGRFVPNNKIVEL